VQLDEKFSLPNIGQVTKNGDIPECSEDPETLCARVWHLTHKSWLAESSHWLIAKPAAIVAILLVALTIRWLVHRMISRVATSTANSKVPVLLRPLKERAPNIFQQAGMVSERRQQRANAIGSILRSVCSVVILAIALMLILDELGINLAPILASAGIVGLALGLGAQTLVRDALSGVFMLLEDQYGVGDTIDVGEASGTVEAVGLRITTLRDNEGVVWYVRNGEILRVGNKSQPTGNGTPSK
jgi:moderate conductance mechanosensitive channel